MKEPTINVWMDKKCSSLSALITYEQILIAWQTHKTHTNHEPMFCPRRVYIIADRARENMESRTLKKTT